MQSKLAGLISAGGDALVRQGFLNLNKEEQERIIEAAIDEFSENSYDAASINRIIHQAGISKGSMYHYFKNKEDLYMHMIDQVMEKKAIYLRSALHNKSHVHHESSFFEIMTTQLQSSILFAKENYRYHKISMALHSMKECDLKRKIWERFKLAFDEYMEKMVDDAIESGEIRNDFDKPFVLQILKLVLLRFTDIYPSYKELQEKKDEELHNDMVQLVEFLKTGLR